MINVGLVGFGFAGRVFHAPIISAVSGLELRAILQRSSNKAALCHPIIDGTCEELHGPVNDPDASFFGASESGPGKSVCGTSPPSQLVLPTHHSAYPSGHERF